MASATDDGPAQNLDDREAVVPLELFFDLVYVFAFTQVTSLLLHDPTWSPKYARTEVTTA